MATPLTATTCRIFLTSIDGTDCIGDTRQYINTNFLNLASNQCSLFTAVTGLTGILNTRITNLSSFTKSLSAKDSPTIDLSFNSSSYFLSADVQDSSLGTIKLGQDVTTFGKALLTSTRIALSSLAGVQLTSTPTVGQFLGWNGGFWTNTNTTTSTLTGLLNDGNKGDISVSGVGAIWTINNNTITTAKILNLAVSNAKLASNSVTNTKIANDAVTTAKIINGAVTTTKLDTNAVTVDKLANSSVNVDKIVNNSVTNAKLAQMPGLSIKGNAITPTGNPTDIIATTDNRVLLRQGGSLFFGTVPNAATSASSTVGPNTIVQRDTNGNFSANTVTANLNGNASSASLLQTGRVIQMTGDVSYTSTTFNGGANATGVASINNNTISTAKIQDGAVTANKIANSSVSESKLTSTAVFNTLRLRNSIELSQGLTGNRFSYVDLVGDDTYTDFGLRLLRGNEGPNSASQLITRGTGPLAIGTIDAGEIWFVTNNTGHCFLRADGTFDMGNININTSGISYPSAAGRFGRFANRIGFTWDGNTRLRGTVDNNVEMEIGRLSDYRLKTNIEPLPSCLDKIHLLKPVSYNGKNFETGVVDQETCFGLLAHEVQEVFPNAVNGEKDKVDEKGNPTYQSVNYIDLIPVLIKAVQELSSEVQSLKAKLNT